MRRCFRIMLDADADLSLKIDHGDGIWISTFINAVGERSVVSTLTFKEP